jgi:hypothetical protein
MSGLDTSQSITDEASQHAEEQHVHSRPHADISGESPLPHGDAKAEATTADDTTDEQTD